jgi:hypothetical protein
MYNYDMAHKTGRPRKRRGQTRNDMMIVRLQTNEKVSFQAAADAAGQDLSVWVRERLRRCSREELEALARPVPFVELAGVKNSAGAPHGAHIPGRNRARAAGAD